MMAVLATGIAAAGYLLLALAVVGMLYMLAVTVVMARFFSGLPDVPASDEAVTLLKPLHGAEPDLSRNLATFLDQDHGGPIQMLCGIGREDDAAVPIARALAEGAGDQVRVIVDGTAHGASGKISNLVNLMPAAHHPVLILSDSDIAVDRRYLAVVLDALDEPGVGAVTLLYRGRGDAGFWSKLGAAGLSYQFLPGAVFGVAMGLADPCMGSTIALRRDTLDRIGGFVRFADVLADDHAIGSVVRAAGLRVAIPPYMVTHASAERSFAELWRHELRWAATVRDLMPGAYAASIIAMPFPLAVAGAIFAPMHLAGGGDSHRRAGHPRPRSRAHRSHHGRTDGACLAAPLSRWPDTRHIHCLVLRARG